MDQLLSSSTTEVSIIDTVTVSESASLTDAITTYLSTVTETETVSASDSVYEHLTTYTTTVTEGDDYGTAPTEPATSSYSESTLIVGGVGQVGGVVISGAFYELWMFFLCPSRECISWREWLTYIPNIPAGWVLGVLALLLALGLLFMAFKCGALEFIFGFLAMAMLCACLFMRAALKNTSVDRFAMYKASLWLNYFAVALLLLLLAHLLFRLVVHLDHTLCSPVRALVGFVYVASLALFALLTAAVVLMFDKHSFARVHTGMQCLQAFVVIALILALILALALMWAASQDHKNYHIAHVIIIGLGVLFLVVWGCYMTAREFLGLDSAARHSEALWYVFNIVPLLLVAVVLLVLNAPSMFTFCHCPVNACPVSNPHVRYSSTGAGPHTHSHDREAAVNRFYM
ncbi:hypothetical protein GGF46_002720 [Coemansia sp. RSA 552]|nr:hypothetical protein GGF46_002720 [Coemansia sp. RSA 552]